VAELAGVSARTVRHYHQIGLLPEPARTANGYRGYEPRDVVAVLRARQLASWRALDEIAGVLAQDRNRELRDVLIELDTDLAEQEHRIRLRRRRNSPKLVAHEERAHLLRQRDLSYDRTRGMRSEIKEQRRKETAHGLTTAQADSRCNTLITFTERLV